MAYSYMVAFLDAGLSTMNPRPTATELGARLEINPNTASNYMTSETSRNAHVLMPERPVVQRVIHMAGELMGTACSDAFGGYLLDRWPVTNLSREEAMRRADYIEEGGKIAADRIRAMAMADDFDVVKVDQGKKRLREMTVPERAVLKVLLKKQASVADVMKRKALMTRHGIKRTNCDAIMKRFATWGYTERLNVGSGNPAWEYAITVAGKAALKRKAPAKAA